MCLLCVRVLKCASVRGVGASSSLFAYMYCLFFSYVGFSLGLDAFAIAAEQALPLHVHVCICIAVRKASKRLEGDRPSMCMGRT